MGGEILLALGLVVVDELVLALGLAAVDPPDGFRDNLSRRPPRIEVRLSIVGWRSSVGEEGELLSVEERLLMLVE